MTQCVIVIDDNPDGTNSIRMYSVEGKGVETTISRAHVKFDRHTQHADCMAMHNTEIIFNLKITCLPDPETDILCTTYDHRHDLSGISREDLLGELSRRMAP